MSRVSPGRRRRRAPRWARWSTEEILDLQFRELDLELEGTPVADLVETVRGELQAKELRFMPHVWLADEWFSPSGVPGVGVPFYLAHPRLTRLERELMLQVEGGTKRESIKYMRHEVGHAICHGFQLQRKRRWQELFGKASTPYPDFYRPNPSSKRFVQHLDAWYAQSHPEEDFAETFAVWLAPRNGWRARYEGWPALRKLEYVDELMQGLRGKKATETSRARPYSVAKLRTKLRTHYNRKRERYTVTYSDAYDRDLKRLFTATRRDPGSQTAASFLRQHRRQIRDLVVRWTGEYAFTVDQVMKEMIGRCTELGLRATPSFQSEIDFAIMLTVHSMNYVHRGKEWHAL